MDTVYYHKNAPERQVVVTHQFQGSNNVRLHYIQTTNPENMGVYGVVTRAWFDRTYIPMLSVPTWQV